VTAVRIRSSLILAVLIVLSAVAHSNAIGQQAPEIRTPKPPDAPRIHGPKIYGVRPNHPFLYRIPSTGIRPIRFSATHLPASLQLDPRTGIITGEAPGQSGDHTVELQAESPYGKDRRLFKIVVGATIGLTPQMGWNDWYTFYDHVTAEDIRKAADAMIASGMADFGYQYVDIDDAWARKPGSADPALSGPARDPQDNILPSARFPNMPDLVSHIHSLGLKAGIYSSPGPFTCAHFEGSYEHEAADARRFAQWGFDLLKYDWCSYGQIAKDKTLASSQAPYRKMGAIIAGLDRDVVLNMCQYGMGDVWQWGRQVGGNSWRTTGDLGLAKGTSLPGFYSIGFANAEHNQYAGPGGWNDPDYILIGTVGDARHQDSGARHTQLTPEEQYSYMSMWSLMASPLFYSGDMTKLDPFTRNVLSNAEVIDIDQDPLGKQAGIVRKTSAEFILAKPLEDGSLAVGLFNLTTAPRAIRVNWGDLGISGQRKIRDVWRQHDRGSFAAAYSTTVPAHGVDLVRLIPNQAR
jgi:alpha-galactosidase